MSVADMSATSGTVTEPLWKAATMVMRRVRPWLFVGTEPSGSDADNALIELANITHTVRCMTGDQSTSVRLMESPMTTTASVRVHVPVLDVQEANLFKLLGPALEAMAQVKQEYEIAKANDLPKRPTVLVYCQAGVSRSVAVTVASLMQCERLSYDIALAFVKQKRAQAEPNAGFEKQLRLFEEIGWTVDLTHPAYRRYLLDLVGQEEPREDSEYQNQQEPWKAVEEGFAGPDPAAADQDLSDVVVYRCRSCKRPIITENDIQDREGLPTNEDIMFITPVEWMLDSIVGIIEGKLICPAPTCGARLGKFNWVGITIGDPVDRFRRHKANPIWVSPGFSIACNKVHKVLPTHAHDTMLACLKGSRPRKWATPDVRVPVRSDMMDLNSAIEYKAPVAALSFGTNVPTTLAELEARKPVEVE